MLLQTLETRRGAIPIIVGSTSILTFIACVAIFPLAGYRRLDAVVLGIAFALPPVVLLYARTKGLLPERSPSEFRKWLARDATSSMALRCLVVLLLVLAGSFWLAVFVLSTSIIDIGYLYIASRVPKNSATP